MRASMEQKELIHVMSYNLMADARARPVNHDQLGSLNLDFISRAPRIINEISGSEASLLCL